jgi:hypothetical protein
MIFINVSIWTETAVQNVYSYAPHDDNSVNDGIYGVSPISIIIL